MHHLQSEDIGDAYACALVTLFGPRVAPEKHMDADAWRSALMTMKPDPTIRYRRGQPWHPRVVAEECAAGQLFRGDIELRLDELGTRAGLDLRVDMATWSSRARVGLDRMKAAASRADLGHSVRWT